MAPAETYECSEQQAFPIDDKAVRRPREEPPLEVNDESGNAPAYLLKLFSEDDEHVDTHAVTASRESTSCNCTAEDKRSDYAKSSPGTALMQMQSSSVELPIIP
jgi:hypothetical protein